MLEYVEKIEGKKYSYPFLSSLVWVFKRILVGHSHRVISTVWTVDTLVEMMEVIDFSTSDPATLFS